MPLNSVNIVANLTKDPEVRQLPNGDSVVGLRVALNERKKGPDGQWADAPNYFSVTCFGKTAEACGKFLTRGRQVAVSGRLRWREYTDKDGNKREAIEIVAHDVQFIGGREGGETGQAAYGGQQSPAAPTQQQDQGDFGGAGDGGGWTGGNSGGGSTDTSDLPF